MKSVASSFRAKTFSDGDGIVCAWARRVGEAELTAACCHLCTLIYVYNELILFLCDANAITVRNKQKTSNVLKTVEDVGWNKQRCRQLCCRITRLWSKAKKSTMVTMTVCSLRNFNKLKWCFGTMTHHNHIIIIIINRAAVLFSIIDEKPHCNCEFIDSREMAYSSIVPSSTGLRS